MRLFHTLNLFKILILSCAMAPLACSSDSSGGAGTTTSPMQFHLEQEALPGFKYDTGLQPASSPVRLQLVVAASGKSTVDAEAYASGGALLSRMASGHTKIDGGFSLVGHLKVDVSGLKYDGDVPGLKNVSIPFQGTTDFDPFSLSKEVLTKAPVPPTTLPPIPLPGGLPGTLQIKIAEGSSIEMGFTGTCAGLQNGKGEYQGTVRRGSTVKLELKVVLKLPIVGDKEFKLPDVQLPIEGKPAAVSLGTPDAVEGTAPPDAGPASTVACQGSGGSNGGAGGASNGGSSGNPSGGSAQGGKGGGTGGNGGGTTGGNGGAGSSGQGSNGGASGGSGMNGCGLTAADPVCNSCLSTQCCAQASSCVEEPECLPLLDCIDLCAEDVSCQDACLQENPNGVAPLDAFFECLYNHCETPCGLGDPGGSGGGAGAAPGCTEDPDGNDDTEASARQLVNVNDCDGDQGINKKFFSSVIAPGDTDWFTFHGTDSFSCQVNSTVTVVSSVSLETCQFASCDAGGTHVTCSQGSGSATSPIGMPGCCATNGKPGMTISCKGNSESAQIYIRVKGLPPGNCQPYSLQYHY